MLSRFEVMSWLLLIPLLNPLDISTSPLEKELLRQMLEAMEGCHIHCNIIIYICMQMQFSQWLQVSLLHLWRHYFRQCTTSCHPSPPPWLPKQSRGHRHLTHENNIKPNLTITNTYKKDLFFIFWIKEKKKNNTSFTTTILIIIHLKLLTLIFESFKIHTVN